MSKWINFEQDETYEGKSEKWNVVSIVGHHLLGIIKWFPAWRQYAFFPEANTIFAGSCFDDIYAFIKNLNNKRRSND